ANNLADWFNWLPDGAIIHAWQLLQQKNETTLARERLLQAVGRGTPVYSQGLRMLIDGLDLFASDAQAANTKDEPVENALKAARRYAGSLDWNQIPII